MSYDISTEKLVNGGWLLSTIINDQYIKRVYLDYPKKEALAAFKEYLKEFQK